MMDVFKKRTSTITEVEKTESGIILRSDAVKIKVEPVSSYIIRVGAVPEGDFAEKSDKFCETKPFNNWKYTEDDGEVCVVTDRIRAVFSKSNGSMSVYNREGKLLFSEADREVYEFEGFTSQKIAPGSEMKRETINTADGEKIIVRAADMIDDKKLFRVKYNFSLQQDEALYGFGQQESGGLNLRGRKLFLFQANRIIAIPAFVSTMGYGIIFNCGSPMIFEDNEDGAYLFSEAVTAHDFYFCAGEDITGVIKNFRILTGKAKLLPKWAYGYIQSKERYENAAEIVETAKEFRDRLIPLDCIVLDWLSWNPAMWGEKQVDKERFPNLAEMTEELHRMKVHFMLSIWPNPDTKSVEHEEFMNEGMLLPGSNVYNPFEKRGREIYTSQLERELIPGGVDAWWCDSSEPYTVEWVHARRPLIERNYSEYCQDVSKNIPIEHANEFCYYHALTAYEATRKNRKHRVCNLTRSAFTGQQKFGTIMWSGDIGASWKTMRDQIAQGLNFCVTGIPYWTFDIGAFFVKTGEQWYWDGEYPEGERDLGYRELFTRWYQLGSLMPVFRAHGTDVCREPWKLDPEEGTFYRAILKADKLRYSLIPYIYSEAGKSFLEDSSIIAPLAQFFAADVKTHNIEDQYMFGRNIMVCPIVQAEYYEAGSVEIDTPHKRRVYFPAGTKWYDFYTKEEYEGGSEVLIDTKLDEIPLFVRAGSIIPVAIPGQYAEDYENIELKVYPEGEASYIIYEDSGDGYEYEEGDYTLRELVFRAGAFTETYIYGSAKEYNRNIMA